MESKNKAEIKINKEKSEIEYRSRNLVPLPNGEQTLHEMYIRTKGESINECLTVFDRFMTKITMDAENNKKNKKGKSKK